MGFSPGAVLVLAAAGGAAASARRGNAKVIMIWAWMYW